MSQAMSVTGITGAAVTLTLPAVAGVSHHITYLEITLYSTAARVGGATPVVVTTTNLPGSLAFTFGTAAAIGTADIRTINLSPAVIDAVTVNTATTIVCPAVVGGLWRVNAVYDVG